MINDRCMVGYKSISELSLKECYDMLQIERDGSRKQALEKQYKDIVLLWHERDSQTFKRCTTIAEFDDYIRQFDVYYYPIQHREEAREAIERIHQRQYKRNRMLKLAEEEENFWETHKNKYLRRQQYLYKYPNGNYKNKVKLFNIVRSIVLGPLYFVPWLIGGVPLIFFILAYCIYFLLISFLPIIVFLPLADIYSNDTLYMIGFGLWLPWMMGILAFTSIRKGEYERGERENYFRMTSWLGNLLVLLNEKMDPIKSRLKDRIDSIL